MSLGWFFFYLWPQFDHLWNVELNKMTSFLKKIIIIIIIYLFIYFCCVGSSFLCEGFLQFRRVGATLHRGARASHCHGLSRCGAQAPDSQAQYLQLTGPVAARHVGSSQTRARTHVPYIGRQILNHCATREAPKWPLLFWKFYDYINIDGDVFFKIFCLFNHMFRL